MTLLACPMCGRSIPDGRPGVPALCDRCLRSIQVDLDREAQIARETRIKRAVGLLLSVLGIGLMLLTVVLAVMYGVVPGDWVFPLLVVFYVAYGLGRWLWQTADPLDRDQKDLEEYLWWRQSRL